MFVLVLFSGVFGGEVVEVVVFELLEELKSENEHCFFGWKDIGVVNKSKKN